MNDSDAMKFILKLSFCIINGIMQKHNIDRSIDFRMNGYDLSSGTIIMNDQIVDIFYQLILKNHRLNGLNEFRIGSLAEQGIERIFC